MLQLATWMMESFYRSFQADTQTLSYEYLYNQYRLPTSKIMDVDGMPVHFTDQGNRTSTVPIICLHGIYGSAHNWQTCSPYLEKMHRVIALDLPNFGLTGPFPSGTSIHKETYSHFLKAFLTKLGIEQCIIMGNSLGGYFAYRFAHDYPDNVKKLVLVDSAGFLFLPPLATIAWGNPFTGMAASHSNLPKSLMDHLVRLAYSHKNLATDDVLDRYYELSLREGNRKGVARLMNFISQTVGVDYKILETLTLPTLIIWGQQDAWIPVQHANKFIAAIENSSMEIMPDAGHLPMEDQPQAFAKIVNGFLADKKQQAS